MTRCAATRKRGAVMRRCTREAERGDFCRRCHPDRLEASRAARTPTTLKQTLAGLRHFSHDELARLSTEVDRECGRRQR